ncbi:MAG: hypothetical protein PHU80_03175 [Kiritimatiellae bacterium]|nr:hypothetical protein [Kiritimatiellia bacterium]
MRSGRTICAAAALCLLWVVQPHAEFFWRFPVGSGEDALRRLGGTRVYHTEAQVNAASGTLSAFAFSAAPSQVAADLARLWSLPPPGPFGVSMLTHADNRTLHRVLIMPSADNSESCVALAFMQPLREAAQAQTTAPDWPEGWPVLEATPLFTAACSLTRSTFVTADSPAPPDGAVAEASRSFQRQGWSETLPASPAGFTILAKGRKHCVIFASADRVSGRTSISLLQREGATP